MLKFGEKMGFMGLSQNGNGQLSVGKGLRLVKHPSIVNSGHLEIGQRVTLRSQQIPIQIKVHSGAHIRIGDDSAFDFGCSLISRQSIEIGSRVSVGALCTIADCDEEVLGVVDDQLFAAAGVTIADDVFLGSRVTLQKGSKIGQGSVIQAGSVVCGDIPPGSIVAGNPAQIVGKVEQEIKSIASEAVQLVHQAIFAVAERTPYKTALICGEQSLSYGDFAKGMMKVAAHLRQAGVQAGDRVLLFVGHKSDYLLGFYGILAAGAVVIPVIEGAALATVVELRDTADARVMLCGDADLGLLNSASANEVCDIVIIEHAVKSDIERSPISLESDAPALVMFTSGTTARKKAVLLSHANLLAATNNINTFMRIDDSIREYVSIPLTHSFGLGRARAVLSMGGTLVLSDGLLNPALMMKSMKEHACNALSAVPAGIGMFMGRMESLLKQVGAQINIIELGSAAMPPDTKLKLLEIFPNARICMHYGLTEASRSAFIEFRSEQHKLHTVGRASPNCTLEIRKPDGSIAAPGEEGEIVVRGDHVTRGYWRDEEINQRVFSDAGFSTGDFGFLDDEGYLHLLGRKDDMINMGGIKISPLELEAKIREVCGEIDACVIGLPDPAGLAGQIPVLVYAADETVTISLAQLNQQLSDKIDRAKLPRAALKVGALPKTSNGKIKRNDLRDQLIAEGRM